MSGCPAQWLVCMSGGGAVLSDFTLRCSGTTRDLLRWAQRQPDSYDSLALHGYLLIAERLRDAEEKAVVLDVLQVWLQEIILHSCGE